MEREGGPVPWWKRVAWLVAIWATSVAALGIVAQILRALIR